MMRKNKVLIMIIWACALASSGCYQGQGYRSATVVKQEQSAVPFIRKVSREGTQNALRRFVLLEDGESAFSFEVVKAGVRDRDLISQRTEGYPDIWARIGNNLSFSHDLFALPITKRQVKRMLKHKNAILNMTKRAQPYLHFIVEEVEKRGMPMEIALLPVVESHFYPLAIAPRSNAGGLWQFTRSTGRFYGLKQSWWYDGRFDVYESTHAALNLLQDLHDRYGDWLLALAAYNWGMGNLDKSIRRSQKEGLKDISYWIVRLPHETRHYVPKLAAAAYLVKHFKALEVKLHPIANEPYIDKVEIDQPFEIARMADAAGMSIARFRQLNPGFRRWAVPPNRTFKILLPADKADAFATAVSGFRSDKKLKWRSYVVKRGDNLYDLSRYYGVDMKTLKKVNRLASNTIVIGQRLIIPVKYI